MRELYIKLPMNPKSKKPIEILDENKKSVGSIQRYLKSKLEKVLDVVSLVELPTSLLNVIGRDNENKVRVNISAHSNWFSKQVWDMEYDYNGTQIKCVIKNTNTIKLHALKEFEYRTKNNTYKIKVKNRNSVFYCNNTVLAEAIPANSNPITDKYFIKIYDENVNIYTIIGSSSYLLTQINITHGLTKSFKLKIWTISFTFMKLLQS